MVETILAIVIAVFGSTGFWGLTTYLLQRRDKTKSARDKILLGLAHDRICCLAEQYIARGSITTDEYENLQKYLYAPYHELGGNGTAERLMEAVNHLELKGGNDSV